MHGIAYGAFKEYNDYIILANDSGDIHMWFQSQEFFRKF